MTLETSLMLLPGLVIGLTVHEFAHAWSASLLGDDFPRRQGRVSLNPLHHLSPLGTLAIFLLPFGWGKPVMTNLYNYRHPKRDYLITSLAGPIANLVMVGICFVLMLWTRHCYRFEGATQETVLYIHQMLLMTAIINALLAVFNLIPIPPLDGSKIWPVLLPGLRAGIKRRTMWIFVAVLVVLMYGHSLDPAFDYVLNGVSRMMPASDKEVYLEARYSGEVAMEAKHYAQADAWFTKALAVNPRSADTLSERGAARLELKNYRGALHDVTLAIALSPPDGELRQMRAFLLDKLGRHDQAKLERQRAQAIFAKTRPPAPAAQTQSAAEAPPAAANGGKPS